MKILFKTNTLNYRGTRVAIEDYATHNQLLLGNESVISYRDDIEDSREMGNVPEVIESLSSRFRIEPYQKDNFNSIVEKVKPDLVYQLVAGNENELESIDCKTATHAVFQAYNGKITAYISKWLSQKMSDGKIPYVPHMIDLPKPTKTFREFLGIPKDAIVVGRHGGDSTFDIPFVRKFVNDCEDKNVFFVFVNTTKFTNNPQCKFLAPIVDKQKLSNYIATCDMMLHARHRGETFGLAICEFLIHDKPVLAWNDGVDRNHIELLPMDALYSNGDNMLDNIYHMKYNGHMYPWKEIAELYSPSNVMTRFNIIFID